jgi:hypothetical protein
MRELCAPKCIVLCSGYRVFCILVSKGANGLPACLRISSDILHWPTNDIIDKYMSVSKTMVFFDLPASNTNSK